MGRGEVLGWWATIMHYICRWNSDVEDSLEEINGRHEKWMEAIKDKTLRINRSKVKYIKYKFRERKHE